MESPRGATEKSSRALICRRSAARNHFPHSTWGSRPRLFIFRASGAPPGTTHGPGKPTTIPKSEIFQSFLFPLANPTCHSDRWIKATALPVIPTEGAKRPSGGICGISAEASDLLTSPQISPLGPVGPSVEMTQWWLLPTLGSDTVEAVEWSGRKIRNPKSEMAMERKFLIPHS